MEKNSELPVFYQDIDAMKDAAPKDKFNLVYWVFLLQGTGVLFPWNAFISAPDYFSALYFPNTMLYFSVAYSVPNLLGLLFMIKFGSKLSLRMKMIPAYVVTFFILILVPILGFAGVNGIVGFSITIILIIMAALCTSLLQGGIFGFAGILPPNYTQAVMSGNGIAGVACSFLRIVTKLTIEQNRKHVPIQTMTISAAVYFFVCALVIIACIVSFVFIMKTPFVQHYLQKAAEPKTSINDQTQQTYDEVSTLVPASSTPKSGIFTVFKKIWIQACLVMTVFWMTISVFPGLSVSVPTYYSGTVMKDWLPILIGTSFNIFDFIGRTAPGFIIMFNRKWVAAPIFVRLLLIPLFVFMYKPSIVGLDAFNDAVPLLAISAVALTNGYLSSLCMMYGPSLVDDHEKETAGTIMTFFLLLGICLGSNTGLVIGQAIPADIHPYVE